MEASSMMDNRKLLAHITEIDGLRYEQTVKQHSLKTAEYAGETLKKVNLFHMSYLGGLLHDMGLSLIHIFFQ